MQLAGYSTGQIQWRGKWHLIGPEPWLPTNTQDQNFDAEVAKMGFNGWDAPDAGITTNATNLGGGTGLSNDNDPRYLHDVESWLGNSNNTASPFFLVASFVNPHDICMGEAAIVNDDWAGYTNAVKDGIPGSPAPIPPNGAGIGVNKPRCQQNSSFIWDASSTNQASYRNFYVGLQMLVDGQIQKILDIVTGDGFPQNTLVIRLADHGEMGLNHAMTEKFYVPYEEVIHVPLIFSNLNSTTASPAPTPLLASSVDLAPTLASLLNLSADQISAMNLRGVDLSPILEDPTTTTPVQEYVHFAYDDYENQYPSHLRTVRTADWKYTAYFNNDGSDSDYEPV